MNYTRLILAVILGTIGGTIGYLLSNRFIFDDRSLPILPALTLGLAGALTVIIWHWKKVKKSLNKR